MNLKKETYELFMEEAGMTGSLKKTKHMFKKLVEEDGIEPDLLKIRMQKEKVMKKCLVELDFFRDPYFSASAWIGLINDGLTMSNSTILLARKVNEAVLENALRIKSYLKELDHK